MAAGSDIEWTDATWPVTDGCADESPGCLNCYAKRFVHRGLHARTRGLTVMGARGPKWTGEVHPVPPEVLAWPLSWKKPKRIFVNSQSDLFHEDVTDEHIAAVFGVMAACPQHTFQVLTKRAERLPRWFEWAEKRGRDGAEMFPHDDNAWRIRQMCHVAVRRLGVDMNADERQNHGGPWPLPNVWLGVSVEDQKRADERIPHLLCAPAAVRFLSCEPLLSAVDLFAYLDTPLRNESLQVLGGPPMPGIDWAIVGGESGPNARPMHPDWVRSLREQCTAAGVSFLFKQWGEWAEIAYDHENPPGDRPRERYLNAAGGHGFHGESVVRIRTARKKENGRILDGRTWDEFPVSR